MDRHAYRRALRAVLTPAERRLFARLDSAAKIQDFLDRIPINFEPDGDTHRSPQQMLKARVAHCTEGALFAAACLAFHGKPALLMDLRARATDQDHVITLFQDGGRWGAISKTNHPVLRWRDPIYRSWSELAMSYAHEYFLPSGRPSLLSYSRPFRLTRYAPARWVTAEDRLDWLVLALDEWPHIALAPRRLMQSRRRVSPLERHAAEFTEWSRRGTRKT